MDKHSEHIDLSFVPNQQVADVRLVEGSLHESAAFVCSYLNNVRTRSAMQYGLASPAWGDVESDRLGYDGAGRMIAKRYLYGTLDEANGYADTTAVAGFTTEYDLSSDKMYERHLHAENRSHLYPAYDSLDRLREYQRGTLAKDSTTGVVSVSTPITLPNANVRQTYDLDGLGNWRRTGIAPVGATAATQVRQHNALNQVTKFGDTAVLYDHGNNTGDAANQGNGNIVDDGTNTYSYDLYNRMVGAASTAETLMYDLVRQP